MLPRAAHDEAGVAGGRRLAGHRDRALAGEVLAGDRRLVLQQRRHAAGVHDLAAVLPRPRADVDDVVGHLDGVLVVLDDDHGVAEVAEADERVDQAVVVALVEPDRRLVEHVEHADQPGADLRGEPDALRLAAGEGGG